MVVQDQNKQIIERFDSISRSYLEQLRDEREDREFWSMPIPSHEQVESPKELELRTQGKLSVAEKQGVPATKTSWPEVDMGLVVSVFVGAVFFVSVMSAMRRVRRPWYSIQEKYVPLDNGLSEDAETKLQNNLPSLKESS